MPLSKRLEPALFALLCAAVAGYLALVLWRYDVIAIGDDAFISFRYAQNLARGRGLVFNPGERIWGFTSPLFTLLLVLPAIVGISLPHASLWLGAFFAGATAIVWWQILRDQLSPWSRLALGIFIVATPQFVWFLGLETLLLVFLQSLALRLLIAGRPDATALAASFACLTRPDAVLFAIPLLLLEPSTRRARPLAIFAFPGVVWLAFALLYYGQPLPNTLDAKKGITPFGVFFADAYQWLTSPSAQYEAPRVGDLSPGKYLVPALALASLRLRGLRRPAPAWAMLGYPFALLVGYAVIGTVKEHRWEFFAGGWFLNVAAAIGALALLELAGSRGVGRYFFRALAALACVVTLWWEARVSLNLVEFAKGYHFGGARQRAYREAAGWLRENLPKESWVAFQEPGTIAFFSDLPIFDTLGLVTYRSLPHPPVPYAIFFTQVEEQELDGRKYAKVHTFPARGFTPFSVFKLAQ